MAGKLTTLLNAAKKAVGLGEKGFVGDVAEHAAKVKSKPRAPAQPRPDPWAEVELARDQRRTGAAVQAEASGPGLVPKGREVPLGGKPAPDHSSVQAPNFTLQAEHQPLGGGRQYPDPASVRAPGYTLQEGAYKPPMPAAAPTPAPQVQAPNYTVEPVAPPRGARPASKDELWAQAKARAEGGSSHFRAAPQSHGGLSLQATPTPAQAERAAIQRGQEIADAHGTHHVSLTRLTEAQKREQAMHSTGHSAGGRGAAPQEAMDFERVDTSRLTIHNPDQPARPGAVTPKPGSNKPVL